MIRKVSKLKIAILVLVASFVLSSCVLAGKFSEYEVGEHFSIEDMEFEKISENCLIFWHHDGETYVCYLEEDDFSEDLLDIYNDAREYTIISGRFSTAYYDEDKLLLRYRTREEQRVLAYWFADNKREYYSWEEAKRLVTDDNRWFKINSESFVETEFHFVAIGDKNNLENLKELMYQNRYIDQNRYILSYDINFENGKYYIDGDGFCKWTISESMLNDHFEGAIYRKGLIELSKELNVEIRITGYSNMTEIREYYRIKNGELLEESIEHVDSTFSWKIFGFGY